MSKYRTRIKRGWTFAKVTLTREQRDEFLTWAEAINEDTVEIMTGVLLEGYKLSIKLDEENETWIATLTGDETSKHNAQTSMSARHMELDTALLLVVYKHTVLCEGADWENAAEPEDWG